MKKSLFLAILLGSAGAYNLYADNFISRTFEGAGDIIDDAVHLDVPTLAEDTVYYPGKIVGAYDMDEVEGDREHRRNRRKNERHHERNERKAQHKHIENDSY